MMPRDPGDARHQSHAHNIVVLILTDAIFFFFWGGGVLIITIVYWAPKPYATYSGPKITRACVVCPGEHPCCCRSEYPCHCNVHESIQNDWKQKSGCCRRKHIISTGTHGGPCCFCLPEGSWVVISSFISRKTIVLI